MTETLFTVIENKMLCSDVYKLTLKADIYEDIKCGQFLSVEIPHHKELLLRRPFAVNDYDSTKKSITFCYKVVGSGTQALSKLSYGERLAGIYPLGNGFTIANNYKTVILLGGGVGIFPLLIVPKSYPDKKYHTLLGFKNKDSAILINEFEAFSKEVLISSEDGSIGAGGFVTDSLKRNIDRIKPDIILSCGPKEMFKALKSALNDYPEIPVFVSLEERMGCGIGACLVCTCGINKNGEVHNKRVCKEGPVFNLNEVVL